MIKTFHTGGDRNLAYLISDDATREAAVIDPSYDPESIATYAAKENLTVRYVFCTHGHGDHTNGNDAIKSLTGVSAVGFGDIESNTGLRVEDGAEYPLGGSCIRVLHTPGHSPDSICLLYGDALFTGDTLFVGKVGGTDLDDGARTEYASLHEKILALPGGTRVLPGHNVGVEPESTLAHEQATNPFLLQPDVEAFIDLKRNWAQYKEEHGIA